MILDQISNSELYPYGPAWEKAFAFLSQLTPDAEEKEYPIQGKEIFARVMSYDTRPPEEAKLEAHMQYIDIQATITGTEAIGWFPTDQPDIKSPYDEAKDVIFFNPSPDIPARLIMKPGLFAVFFPDDAHMPQLSVGETRDKIKKVVVKIRRELIQ